MGNKYCKKKITDSVLNPQDYTIELLRNEGVKIGSRTGSSGRQ